MLSIKIEDSRRVIPVDMFHVCLLDGKTKEEIRKKYPKRSDGAYYLDKFENHLKDAHGNTGNKHTEESKQKMREATAKRFQRGDFAKKSGIQIKVQEFLQILNLNEPFLEEFHEKYYSLDFAFKNAKVCIEVQGQYFHIDPRFYPDGPQDAIQRRNFGRDKAKRKFLESRGWTIIEVWEKEINNEEYKEYLKCKLQELNLLNQ